MLSVEIIDYVYIWIWYVYNGEFFFVYIFNVDVGKICIYGGKIVRIMIEMLIDVIFGFFRWF